MKKLLLLFSLIILLSCNNKGEKLLQTSNDKISVELLFELDGCKIYRFKDGGNFYYYTNCQGKVEWKVQGNKTSKDISIETNNY